jgi:MraZ protein
VGISGGKCGKRGHIVFLGEYEHSLDSKGRLAVPAKFRLRLGEGAVITRGLDGCLIIYPSDKWQEIAERLDQLPSTHLAARIYKRFVFSGASECDFDRQGRVLIPAFLREYAGIGDTAMVVGQYSVVEVWGRDRWEAMRPSDPQSVAEAAAQLAGLGLDI